MSRPMKVTTEDGFRRAGRRDARPLRIPATRTRAIRQPDTALEFRQMSARGPSSTGADRHGAARVVLASFLGAFLLASPARPTSYNISTLADDATTNGNCTLREALRAANTDLPVDACAAGGAVDEIVLPAGIYPFGGAESLSGGGITLRSATLDPVTVTVNLAAAGRFLGLAGGGSYTIRGITIANGVADVGGAIQATGVSLSMSDFEFRSNTATKDGGGLAFVDFAASANALVLERGKFELNHAQQANPTLGSIGGAVMIDVGGGQDADLRDIIFLDNSIAGDYASGGGLSVVVTGAGTSARCLRCVFDGNTATGTQASSSAVAGLYAEARENALLRFEDSRFTANDASVGASGFGISAVFLGASTGGTITVDRLLADSNLGTVGENRDLRVQLESSSAATITNAQLTRGTGTGLSGLVIGGSTLEMGHVTVAGYDDSGMIVSGDVGDTMILQNSIAAFNTNFNLSFSGPLVQTTNLIGGDPLFVDSANGDFRLTALSPARDAGTSSVTTMRPADVGHAPRLAGTTTDIGGFEYGGLFADDFESGDAGAWSNAVP